MRSGTRHVQNTSSSLNDGLLLSPSLSLVVLGLSLLHGSGTIRLLRIAAFVCRHFPLVMLGGESNACHVNFVAILVEFDLRIPSLDSNAFQSFAQIIKLKVRPSHRTLELLVVVFKVYPLIVV